MSEKEALPERPKKYSDQYGEGDFYNTDEVDNYFKELAKTLENILAQANTLGVCRSRDFLYGKMNAILESLR